MRTLTQTPNAHPLFPERKGKALRLEGNYQIPAPPPHSPRDKGSGQKPGRMRAFQPLLMASAALVLSSGAAFANCGGALGINILASGGSTCFANGQYISTTLVAGEATGAGSVLTNNTGAGLNSVLFSTSTQAAAVWADTGGTVTLTASPLATVTLNTSGAGAAGLYATGARSTITATGIANTSSGGPTTSSGFQSSAVDAETSASITLNGGSIFKNGNSGLGIFATSGGSVNATGTTITADGNGVQALFVTNGGSLVGSGLTINSYGTTDPVTGLNASIGSNGYGSTPNGGTLQLSNSTFATTGDYNFGIATSNNGVTTLTNNQITVSGANAQAINTSTGGQTTINGGSISSTGVDGTAVSAVSGSQVTINGGSITASGLGSSDFFASDSGTKITASNVQLSTTGGVDTETGYYPTAVAAQSGATIAISGGSISISSANSNDLYATGAGSKITANGVTLTTSGGPYSNTIDADSGAVISVIGGSASTSGTSSFVAGVTAGGTLTLSGTTITGTGDGSGGIYVNGTGGTLTASNLIITTHGDTDAATGDNAAGAYNGSFGTEYVGGGAMTLNNVSITTSGNYGQGVVTQNSGTTSVYGGSITTSGNDADAIQALSGAQVLVQGTTISTSGDGSKGFDVQGTGTVVTINGVNVTTTGTVDTNPATGDHSQALYNGDGTHSGTSPTGGGVANVTNSTFATQGVNSVGVDTLDGGKTFLTGGSVTTSGVTSAGVVSDSSAFVSLTGVSVTTTGNGSTGLGINGAGEADAKDATIVTSGGVDSTTGDHANGVYNGPSGSFTAGGIVKLADVSVSTSGAGSNGVVTSSGGTTTVSGGSVKTTGLEAFGVGAEGGGNVTISGASVATAGDASKGLLAIGTGSSLTASDLTVTTTGTTAEDGHHAYAVFNGTGSGTSYIGGGTVTLSNVAVEASGAGSDGVMTANGGVTNLSGSSVATSGQDAHALVVSGSGSQTNLSGTNTFATQGAGANGLVASLGGVIISTGLTRVTTSGGLSPATGFGANGVVADGTGAQVKLGSATITTSGSGSFGLIAGDSTSSGHAGSISATGTLNVTTTNPAAAAVALQGNGAAILATGGGTITSAGQAIAFLGGTGQTATFDNFNINNVSGDLIFADPSIGTVNFNGTTANAGSSNLLDATNFSAITLNANASTLTGAIRSDPTSTTNVNLNNGTTWTVTGPSTVTNLSVANSIVVFAPPGSGQAFKTLTVTNYVGSGVEHHDECRDRRCLIGRRPDHRQRRERNRPHPPYHPQGRLTRRTDLGLRHPARRRDQWRIDRDQRLRARQHTRRRGLSLRARPVQRHRLSHFDSGPDGRRGDAVRHQSRPGAAELDHHQPRAQFGPARGDPADQQLQLRRRLRLCRLVRGGHSRALGPQRRTDAARRLFLCPVGVPGDHCRKCADPSRIAGLRFLEVGLEPSVPRGWRSAHPLRRCALFALLRQRTDPCGQ